MTRTGWRSHTHLGAMLALCITTVILPADVCAQQDAAAGAVADSLRPHDPGYTKIMVMAHVDKDSVILRWAPGTPHGWRVANRTGYVVERRSGSGDFVRLTPDTLHPWMAQQFIDVMREHPDNKYAGLVLNALWGDSLLISPGGADTVGDDAVRNTNLFGYALFAADNDPFIADAMGLRFVDRSVKQGDRYTYRIRMNEPRDYRIDPGEVEVEIRPARPDPPPVNVRARALDRRIELRWDPQPADEYTGYMVYRSADGGKKFVQMNSSPIVIVTSADTAVRAQGGFTDTTVLNYKTYVFRIQGITAFGGRGSAAEVKAMAHDLTPPPAPMVKNPKQAGRTSVQLSWEMPPAGPDLLGFTILRSAYADSNYHALTKKPLPKNTRQYTDKKADDAEPYYIVTSLDTAGNQAPSFAVLGALIDTLPPAVPTGLHGVLDSSGVVRLTWNRNTERNILGYRVLRANAPDHEFTQLTGSVWPDSAYTDTIAVRTLTRFVYYRIAAVNTRYNHSRPSPVLALKRDDITPPESPVFFDVQTSDSAVILRWAPSGSADVQAHVLSRRTAPSDAWVQIATLPREAVQYTDRVVQQNTTYDYRIEAVDSSGLRSAPGMPVQARPYDTGIRPAVSALSAVFDQQTKTVSLTWSYAPPGSEKGYFLVYRKRNSSPLLGYRSVDGALRTFVDTEISEPGIYEYAVKVITQSGAESPTGERVRVSVQNSGK